jgi:uncharacterized protein (TIGR02466 family)
MDFEIEVHHLFSTPLYVSKIKPIEEEEFKFIENLEYEVMFSGNGKYTKNKYILECDELSRIKKEVQFHVDFFSRNLLDISSNVKFYTTNSWSVLHEPRDWGQMHMHTNSLISGVLYTKVSEDSGNIVFHRNSLNSIFPTALDLEYNQKNILNARTWSIKPENNMIVLFPSHVLHSIDENKSDQNRYSLAFNFFIKGHLGKDEFELVLP